MDGTDDPDVVWADAQQAISWVALRDKAALDDYGKLTEAKMDSASDAAIDQARDAIVTAIRGRNITAYGRRGSGAHEPIPLSVFLGPVTIDLDGTVREDERLPCSERLHYRGPPYGDVRFRVDELRSIWVRDVITGRNALKPTVAAPGWAFLDVAVERIKDCGRMPEGPAVVALLARLRSGEVRAEQRRGLRRAPRRVSPAEWHGADIDLGRFRERHESGLTIGGAVYHLHSFVVSEEDLQHCFAALPIQDSTSARPTNDAPARLKGAVTDAVGGAPGRGGGRPPKYPWGSVLPKALEWLEDNGAPAQGDGGQAELERFVTGLFPPDNCPAESAIRKKIGELITAFRTDLQEARN